ncbi:NAD(P)/FAD-dependent oxidoreductase [Martelella alba]|uniref:NAD(P)/FAD-dependent oxidoreductase n=1 Tax=Martelella alba TaxID=2590451 RepID=A0A506UDQ0_9HYPH|nr:NAD(P)/FAD-dependent oxidoreductase [Martelella alba]TPW30789.1 NAD(P)/FAD-dependent oxidoreductase [Martelella alba]
MEYFDVAIIGAGAAGLMCALTAGKAGKRVVLIDHARSPGEKIRISGGGRCNFTNIHAGPKNYLSENPHFAKSALSRYQPADFIDMVERHGIAYHEKTLGQLFCDGSAKEIVDMLTGECRRARVDLRLATEIGAITHADGRFRFMAGPGDITADKLVMASGGKSIPKMGATGLSYQVAEQFGLGLVETRAGLVPFTLEPGLQTLLAPLAGIGVPAELGCGRTRFREALLFTHRGLSGPAVLQISSYWQPGAEIVIRILPNLDLADALIAAKRDNGRQTPVTALAAHLPKRLAQFFAERAALSGALADLPDKALRTLAASVQDWRIKPAGTEGYRTAEVTLGGVDTRGLSSRTMEAKTVPGLYFIGECVDVTGWLGGYNFQWAWSSGFAAGTAIGAAGEQEE